MQSWNSPEVPEIEGTGDVPRLHDTASGELLALAGSDGRAGLYVCGITPYDSTHLGHAATYVAFDTLNRAWRDHGLKVTYVQNVTDVDDPLLDRAKETGVEWRDLAEAEIAKFRGDMEALRVIPPDHYVSVVDSIGLIAAAVTEMLRTGSAYVVGDDVYADLSADTLIGSIGHLDDAQMDELFAERGGDPDTPGKRHPRDPLLWRGRRDGEPSWPGGDLGEGRPGWHIECAAIAKDNLGIPFTVQGGGYDLVYPHHEMSTSHLREVTGRQHPAEAFVHTGLVGYQGHKMSKSRGNLVFVSQLAQDGVPADVVRLTLLAQHYRTDWEYTTPQLYAAARRWQRWQDAAHLARDVDETETIAALRAAIADDLDTPRALAVVDAWAGRPRRGRAVIGAVSALLGIEI
ncbi:cysteine--1-D-myo-inosityl 2-amino-2-deoxy-alpha-D-glucopyranoside ligase [Pseudactinotalea terrae]|uniref:cysteine--1-D-myo-inosityl 2-amino-2-deoxy-alpha-D-glucopyranoside ligase n=1 Tax=Pseudactinotalea terrae TaxID=1743262 RepID=UPI0012E2C53F|nr:cysteine--1-D-myo-inosityl 2-amino-2-deoxy-alpha-D-glucopyranoside ligase [Pseudactinotalea terrae]